MIDENHFRKLEQLYATAPISHWYGASIDIGDGISTVHIPIRRDFLHAAHAVHGSVYFRALDDAAFFAANSRVSEVLVLTVSFTTHFLRPVVAGHIRAVGRIQHAGARLIIASSELHDDTGALLATGSGVFTRSSIPLDDDVGYGDLARSVEG